MLETVLSLQFSLSVALFILIWLIQILHYPSFKFYSENDFVTGMKFHQRRITYIVLPLMISELVVSLFLLYQSQKYSEIIFALVFLIWVSTFTLQVPLHRLLEEKKDLQIIKRLITSNWIRTILWSLKLLIVFCLIFDKFFS